MISPRRGTNYLVRAQSIEFAIGDPSGIVNRGRELSTSVFSKVGPSLVGLPTAASCGQSVGKGSLPLVPGPAVELR